MLPTSIIRSENDYKEAVDYCKNVAYDFCVPEMCDGEEILEPKITYVKGLKKTRLRGEKGIEFPSFRDVSEHINKYATLIGMSHEMPHHFHFVLNTVYSKNKERSQKSLTIEEIIKDNNKKQKWREGVAYRVEEKVLLKSKGLFQNSNDPIWLHGYKEVFEKPKKFISKILTPTSTIPITLEMFKNNYFNDFKQLERAENILEDYKYLMNSRQGWLVVRKLPKLKFKKLLKDTEAHKKINWKLD